MSGEKTCLHCSKRVADEHGLYLHVKAKHGRKAAKAVRPARVEEPSLADELVAAEIAFAEGIEPPTYLRSMFPESFVRAAISQALGGEA